jgi:hypothetical protein
MAWERVVRFVDGTSAFRAEGDCQFLATFMHSCVLLVGASDNVDFVLWEQEIERGGSAADLAAGEAVASCLRVYWVSMEALTVGGYPDFSCL